MDTVSTWFSQHMAVMFGCWDCDLALTSPVPVPLAWLPSGSAGLGDVNAKKSVGTCLVLSFHKPKEASRSLQLGMGNITCPPAGLDTLRHTENVLLRTEWAA